MVLREFSPHFVGAAWTDGDIFAVELSAERGPQARRPSALCVVHLAIAISADLKQISESKRNFGVRPCSRAMSNVMVD